jgi:hypothetical protein
VWEGHTVERSYSHRRHGISEMIPKGLTYMGEENEYYGEPLQGGVGVRGLGSRTHQALAEGTVDTPCICKELDDKLSNRGGL